MQVTNINNNTIQIKAQGSSSPFKSGTQLKATVTQVNPDGTVVLESDKGGTFTASNTSNYGLNVGDTVSLLVTEPSHDGSVASTSITQINGQPIDQNVSLRELHLIDLGIMPNATNLRMYNVLDRSHHPLTKEYVLNLKEVFTKLPDITDEQAAFLAANNIEPTPENLEALTHIGTLHKDISTILQDSMQQIINSYGLDKQAVNNILSALENVTSQPQTANPEMPVDTSQQQTTIVHPEMEVPQPETPQAKGENIATILSQEVISTTLIPDKNQTLVAAKNYSMTNIDIKNPVSETAMNIAPKVADAVISSLLDKVMSEPQVSLKTISELKLPEKLPAELQQTIDVLPEETQQEIIQMLPKMLQSTKEFLSVKLVKFTEQQLNVPIDKETSGVTLKNNIKNIPEHLNSILSDKPGAAAQRVVTTLKLSDSTMSFVQIPVSLNDFKTSAEIYVVKRDEKQKLSLENGVKLVFALNTEYMGRIESIISANTKDLNLNIRVENKDVMDAVQREQTYLKTLLSATTFNLSVFKVTMIDKPTTVLNAHTHFGYKQLDITV